ncbi:MAG TPA: AglZ/HisF2 family acetamidino modification protein [Flavobacterium sp.]|nr:AglZ/HisF2 family acetamidino modification protein [Flavobacterium sp.]
MLRPRIIPSLLIHNNGLVKTVNFKNPKYVGDPINAVKIFNEKEVDELVIFDIDATVLGKEPDYKLIEKLACQSRMPLCYGGGVKTVEQAQKIYSLGIEKIAISSAAINNPGLISEIAVKVGTQSVAVVLDIKRKFLRGYEIVTNNAKISIKLDPVEFALEAQELGAGEIIINNVDKEGTLKGYDWELIDKFREVLHIPMTTLGGASSLENIKEAIYRYEIMGLAAGSLFVFKGKHKAVLINYPSKDEKENLYKK